MKTLFRPTGQLIHVNQYTLDCLAHAYQESVLSNDILLREQATELFTALTCAEIGTANSKQMGRIARAVNAHAQFALDNVKRLSKVGMKISIIPVQKD